MNNMQWVLCGPGVVEVEDEVVVIVIVIVIVYISVSGVSVSMSDVGLNVSQNVPCRVWM